jgi:hypothetical protein
MVNNQIEFNNKFLQEKTEIKLKNKCFVGQLVIADYSNLKKLNLRNVKTIDKIILRNLVQLQECTISDCGVKELVIENCPQAKELNVSDNSLTNLEFLISLEKLEKLELERNAELIEILKPYQGDWKNYKKDKDVQEIFKLTKQNNLRELAKKCLDLKNGREDLKIKFSLISKKTQQPTTSKLINTKELVFNLGKEFKDKEARINFLEFRVWELTELSEEQGKQIHNYLNNFGSEEELLRKLIKSYLEFIKFKKQGVDSLDYDEKYSEREEKYKELENQLWTRLTKKKKSEARRILVDCEKLVEWELEIETNLDDTSKLIEEQKQDPEITDDSEKNTKLKEQETTHQNQIQQRKRSNSVLLEIKLAYNRGKVEGLERSFTPIPENQNETLISELISELKEKSTLTPKEQEIFTKVKDLLGAKRIFLNTRQITIKGLQNCYNRLKGNKKYDKADEVGSVISAVGGVAGPLTFDVPRAFGEAVIAINNSFKRKFSDKQTDKFQELLINDKENFFRLNQDIVKKIYSSLTNSNSFFNYKLASREVRLFNIKHEIFKIENNLWKDKPFSTTEEMEEVIKLLSENWDRLEIELKAEERQFKEFVNVWEQNQQQTQTQIPPK